MRIVVEGVSHRFQSLEVLSGVSFDVGDNEVFAIVGPSGCGKSTLLSIIGGLIEPTSGRVRVGGWSRDALNPITFIFQDFALLPWRSVAGNVQLPLEHRNLTRAEVQELVADALQRTGVTDFADAYPKQLSGGMRQRVGIARALAVKPSILLMDEPLSALDGQTREILMEDLSGLLASTRLSALYVTHNLDEALRLADRIAVFSRRPGRLREIIDVAIPRSDRIASSAAAELATLHKRLWSLIRDEAIDAEREIAHV
ncbi:MAG: NitT/TauT family transport system ATP-binding protein [Methylobacteriaceae bacterium]|jgi:NitT/TauT family transport system ATP-binding protein|nr:NitT/TauT family transport system ATP-binding protein [Methylobacteriaceae bacterium]